MKIALLTAPADSGKGVYLRMDETDAPGPCHLPTIAACDLTSGTHIWIPDSNPTNPYGGAFHSLAVIAQAREYERLIELEKKATR